MLAGRDFQDPTSGASYGLSSMQTSSRSVLSARPVLAVPLPRVLVVSLVEVAAPAAHVVAGAGAEVDAAVDALCGVLGSRLAVVLASHGLALVMRMREAGRKSRDVV